MVSRSHVPASAAVVEPGAVGLGVVETVPAGVAAGGVDRGQPGGGGGEPLDALLQAAQPPGQPALGAGMVGGQPGQAGHFGADFGVFADQRVAGGHRFDLGVGQHDFGVEVLDGADRVGGVDGSGDLGDEPGLAFDGAPHVRVEAAGGDVAHDVHGRVLVALAQDAAFALFDVGRAPRHVDVMQGDEALLDVDAGAHLLG